MEESGEVVVPLEVDRRSLRGVDPDLLLESGRAFQVLWSTRTPATSSAKSYGPELSGASVFARGLTDALSKATPVVSGSRDVLVSLRLPAGSTYADLMPAVGGGLRAMTRGSGSSKVSGHALITGPAAIKKSASLAKLGPVAFAAGLQMMADHAMQRQLAEMDVKLDGLQQHELDKLVAQLQGGLDAVQRGVAAIADGATSVEVLGIGPALNDLGQARSVVNGWLDRWCEAGLGQKTRNGDRLTEQLKRAAVGGLKHWETQVALTQSVIGAHARLTLVSEQLLRLANSNLDLWHSSEAVSAQLRDAAGQQQRLRDVVTDLALLDLTTDRRDRLWPFHPGNGDLQKRFVRISTALHRAERGSAASPGVLEVTAIRRPSGALRLLAPADDSPAA